MADKEIDKIITGSELREMADFLADPKSEITDCVLCYQTKTEVGYNILGGSSIATLIGLLSLTSDQMRDLVYEMLDEASKQES